MKKTKRLSCILLTIVLMVTTFIVNGNTAEAKAKNTKYSCNTYEIKSFKKSKGKLIVKCKKDGWMTYIPDGCERTDGIQKITYKLAKSCKWRYVDNDRKKRKASYKAFRKQIKIDNWEDNPNWISIKIKKGKIVNVTIYRYYG